MDEIIKYVVDHHWGDVASVLEVIIAVIGFIVTIVSVMRSKKAAQRAEQAALKVRDDILKVNTIAEFSAAIVTMDEIKRLHRENAWIVLPDRYSALKKTLISIRSANPDMSNNHKTVFQSAIQHFSNFEKQIETVIATNSGTPDVPKLNQIISRQIDRLTEVLVEMKNNFKGESHGHGK